MSGLQWKSCFVLWQVLEGCIGASMLAACQRMASSCAPAAASTEEKLTAAARGVNGLFEDVSRSFANVLNPHHHG